MSEGKKTIWKIANPLVPDGVPNSLVDEWDYDSPQASESTGSGTEYFPSPKSGTEFFPSALYGLNDSSTSENNPYLTAIHALAPLLLVNSEQPNIPQFFAFIEHMQPKFKRLVEQKDARALVLMAYWYAKVCHALWWVTQRAMLECQATCLYLERYHAGDTAILQLLQFPKTACGLG